MAMNFDVNSIMETIEMIKVHHLDIRTVTLALSLRDCCSNDSKTTANKIYDKITKYAKNLSKFADELEDEYSIPIINKRIAVTPISIITESIDNPDFILIAKTLDKAAKEVGVDFLGGYSALVEVHGRGQKIYGKHPRSAFRYRQSLFFGKSCGV